MPNVPNLPGVPDLSSYAPFAEHILGADTLTVLGGIFLPRWGVFRGGIPVVTCDNVVSVDYKQDLAIASYPIEQGQFTSYDKVNSPFEARVRFSSGGSLSNRQDLLNSIIALSNSLSLFEVVTPEINYIDVNLSHFDYHRSAERGVGLINIDTWWTQIRQTAESAFTNTKQPNGASVANGGLVQPASATSGQISKVGAGVQ